MYIYIYTNEIYIYILPWFKMIRLVWTPQSYATPKQISLGQPKDPRAINALAKGMNYIGIDLQAACSRNGEMPCLSQFR